MGDRFLLPARVGEDPSRPGWLIARSADIRVSDGPPGHASGGCEAGWHGKQLMQ
jgi:hypothetical protein